LPISDVVDKQEVMIVEKKCLQLHLRNRLLLEMIRYQCSAIASEEPALGFEEE
jgi:hypothetical protein